MEESIPESVQGEDQIIELTQQGEDQVIRRTERVPSSTAYETRQVKTGDPNQLLLLSAVALASGLVLLVLGAQALKKRKQERSEESAHSPDYSFPYKPYSGKSRLLFLYTTGCFHFFHMAAEQLHHPRFCPDPTEYQFQCAN